MEVKDKLQINEAEGSSMMVLVIKIKECPEADIVWVQGEIRRFIGILRAGRPTKASAPQAGTMFIKSQILVIQDAASMTDAWKTFHEMWPTSKKAKEEIEEQWRTLHPLTVTPPAEAAGLPAAGSPSARAMERESRNRYPEGETGVAALPPSPPPEEGEEEELKEKDPEVEAIVRKYAPPGPTFKRGQVVRHKDPTLRKDFGVGAIRRTDLKTTPGKILYMVKFPVTTEWVKEEEIELTELEGDVKK